MFTGRFWCMVIHNHLATKTNSENRNGLVHFYECAIFCCDKFCCPRHAVPQMLGGGLSFFETCPAQGRADRWTAGVAYRVCPPMLVSWWGWNTHTATVVISWCTPKEAGLRQQADCLSGKSACWWVRKTDMNMCWMLRSYGLQYRQTDLVQT